MADEDEPIAKAAYDELANGYDAEVRTNPYNAHLEFPATSALIPDVDGKRMLDAGCGTGVYTEWLLERGADVVAFDVSDEMLAHARDRTGTRATFHRAALERPYEFADADSFDGIVCALALAYVRDLSDPFAEFARVVRPGGFLVFSMAHPMDQFPFQEDEREANYFEEELREKDWDAPVPYYRRPLEKIINPLLEAGFRLERFVEPQPTAAFEEQWPQRYAKESRYPTFLCIRAHYPAGNPNPSA